MCDVNLWSAGKSQKQLRKNLKLLQTLCDSVQSLHGSCDIASKKRLRCRKIQAVTAQCLMWYLVQKLVCILLRSRRALEVAKVNLSVTALAIAKLTVANVLKLS